MPIKVILDTDIGSDIDDAVCLAYLLAQMQRGACELLGVTTVSGGVVPRAQMASAQCLVAGLDVPIYPGIEGPLFGPQRQPYVPQAAALAQWPHARDFPRGEAIEFLRRTIRRYPQEVILLTIGPLTNAGLLYAVDPEAASLLKAHVLMGGVFNLPTKAEWNALCDPHATALVCNADVPSQRFIGLDVTTQVTMDAPEVRARFGEHELLHPVLDFAEVWFRERQVITFHDPLAAVTIFDPEVCQFSPGHVTAELEGVAGRTTFKPAAAGEVTHQEVAFGVDPERFFCSYFAAFGA